MLFLFLVIAGKTRKGKPGKKTPFNGVQAAVRKRRLPQRGIFRASREDNAYRANTLSEKRNLGGRLEGFVGLIVMRASQPPGMRFSAPDNHARPRYRRF